MTRAPLSTVRDRRLPRHTKSDTGDNPREIAVKSPLGVECGASFGLERGASSDLERGASSDLELRSSWGPFSFIAPRACGKMYMGGYARMRGSI